MTVQKQMCVLRDIVVPIDSTDNTKITIFIA